MEVKPARQRYTSIRRQDNDRANDAPVVNVLAKNDGVPDKDEDDVQVAHDRSNARFLQLEASSKEHLTAKRENAGADDSSPQQKCRRHIERLIPAHERDRSSRAERERPTSSPKPQRTQSLVFHLIPTTLIQTYEEEGHDRTREDQDARVRQHHLRHGVEGEAHAREARDAAVKQHLPRQNVASMDEKVKVMYLMNVDMKLKHTDATATQPMPSSAWCCDSVILPVAESGDVVGSSGASSFSFLGLATLIFGQGLEGPRLVDE
ncbi:unnamed protein product [Phytophthora fragariaefolia]|uniref:Unnamed protein product n=1 Tax=Phytophthora fragariaefolia TaxID=1490495 RepID=A0A9W6XXF0_9STRA|nr:unnamed protein product [Phytophthora fragariaefolia]